MYLRRFWVGVFALGFYFGDLLFGFTWCWAFGGDLFFRVALLFGFTFGLDLSLSFFLSLSLSSPGCFLGLSTDELRQYYRTVIMKKVKVYEEILIAYDI